MRRISVLTFAALWITAMAVYPGWNAFDPDSLGHDFGRNFLCDILSSTTPDGRSNAWGALAINTGALVLVLGALLPAWWRHQPVRPPWRTIHRALSLGATALILLICVEQAFGLSWSHNIVTLTAAALGLGPTAVAAVTDWRSKNATALRRALIAGTLAASLANFGSYALVQLGGTLTTFVPIAQKAALACLVGWLYALPAASGRNGPLARKRIAAVAANRSVP